MSMRRKPTPGWDFLAAGMTVLILGTVMFGPVILVAWVAIHFIRKLW